MSVCLWFVFCFLGLSLSCRRLNLHRPPGVSGVCVSVVGVLLRGPAVQPVSVPVTRAERVTFVPAAR